MVRNSERFAELDRRLREERAPEGTARAAIRSRIELPDACDPIKRTAGQYVTDFVWRVRAERQALRENRERRNRQYNNG